mmetsp:Transcript_41557/g.89232  ORF Transcript_41557/g.89232 Transcript_41557/m.89232 type:complete len:145 (+) Transcript_41557:59-493(+)
MQQLWLWFVVVVRAFAAIPLSDESVTQDSCLLAKRFDLRKSSVLRTLRADECSADSSACPPCGTEATCMLWGDPHIYVFDGGASFRLLESGDYWLVKSDCVQIQAIEALLPRAGLHLPEMVVSNLLEQEQIALVLSQRSCPDDS